MAKVIGLVNQKGGVAKTTTASALAFGLALKDKKVLLIDFDPQGNLTTSCGVTVETEEPPTFAMLGLTPGRKNVVPKNIAVNVDIIASSIGLETANIYLSARTGREQFLKRAIAKLKAGYDYIIIDSNPSLSMLTLNVLVACDEVIIPFKPEFHSMRGIMLLFDTINELQAINADVKVRGFLATMCDSRRNSTSECIAEAENVAEEIGSKVYDSHIRVGVAAADAPSSGKSIYDYKGGSAVAADYLAFVDEFLREEQCAIVNE